MKATKNSLILFFIIILIASCENIDKQNYFDYGLVENGVYQNEYFNIKIVLPPNWVVQTKEQTENLVNTGKQLISGDDDKLKALIKVSEINTAYLLAVFQFEVGSAVEYNPNIMLVAENTKNAPGVKNGSDYLFQTRKLLEQGQFKYDYISDKFELEKINDIEFYKMYAMISFGGMEISQVYYATIMKGFCLGLIISFHSDDQKNIILKSINSITIAK